MRLKKALTVMLSVFFCAAALSACSLSDTGTPEVADDEIELQIQLDTREDIGMLVVHYDANDSAGSGGVANADRSPLRPDELLFYTLYRQDFNHPSDVRNLSIQFVVITEYFEPNLENRYPTAYTKPLEAISLSANFGESYSITISGDQTNGYRAILAQ